MAVKISEGSIIVLGKRLHYIQHRFAENNDKPTIVLIHGLGRDLRQWRGDDEVHDVFSKLAKNFDVFAFDIPGFGLSGKLEDYEIDVHFSMLFMRELFARKDLQITKPVLVGESFGGLLALEYARIYSDDVSGLVLMNSAGLGQYIIPSWRIIRIPVIGEAILEIDSKYPNDREIPWKSKAFLKLLLALFRYAFLKGTRFGDPSRRLSKKDYNNLRLLQYAIGPKGQNSKINRQKVLNTITAPTLILMGSHDDVFSAKDMIRAFGEMPNAVQPYIFKGAGHFPPQTHPNEFVEVVGDFLLSIS